MNTVDVGLYVVIWQVRDPARARQVREILRFAGQAVRSGVVEVAATATRMRQLQEQIGVHLRDGDTVRIYPVCRSCRRRVRLFGEGDLAGLPVVWII